MLIRRMNLLWLGSLAGLICCGGCSSGTPTRVQMAEVSPGDAGKKAVELYDANHDGAIAGDELKKVPAIKGALSRFDGGGDGKVTADTIAKRIQAWRDQKVAVISIFVQVTMDGAPLDGATVTFEPESFLGPAFQTSTGTTDAHGSTMLKMGDRSGTQVAIYKVKVSKQVAGKEVIPPRYNTDTELGAEVAQDVPEIARAGKLVFALKSQ